MLFHHLFYPTIFRKQRLEHEAETQLSIFQDTSDLLCLFRSLPYLTTQTERLTDLLTILHKMFPSAKIVGHRDLPSTTSKSCPCFNAHEVFGYIEKL